MPNHESDRGYSARNVVSAVCASLRSFAAVLALVVGAAAGSEAPPVVVARAAAAATNAGSTARRLDVRGFLVQHCVACHGPDKQKGEVRFDHLDPDKLDGDAVATLRLALVQLDEGAMPPASKPRPDADTEAAIVAWMRTTVAAASPWPQPPLRRLSRTEYANAVHDLLGVRDDLAEMLPGDPLSADGFGNESEQLQVTPIGMRAYLAAARRAAAAVMSPPPVQHWTLRFADADPYSPSPPVPGSEIARGANLYPAMAACRDDLLVFWDPPRDADGHFGNLGYGYTFSLLPITVAKPGLYRVRLKAAGIGHGRIAPLVKINWASIGGLPVEEQQGMMSFQTFVEAPVTTAPFHDDAEFAGAWHAADEVTTAIGQAVVAKKPPPIERIAPIDPVLGAMWTRIDPKAPPGGLPWSRLIPPAVAARARERAEPIECVGRLPAGMIKLLVNADDTRYDRWVFVTGGAIEVEGPLETDAADPVLANALAHEDAGAYAAWLGKIMGRAFRRPIAPDEPMARIAHARADLGPGASFADCARLALAGVLCAPEFLTVVEAPRRKPELPRALTGRELATRIALLLWRSVPDAELLHAADAPGGLAGPALDREIKRMLADARSERFIHEYTEGWLGLAGFDLVTIDPNLYPDTHDPRLADSLRREPDEFVSHLVAADKSLLDCIRSDWLTLDRRIAAYYGIDLPPGSGDGFRVVDIPPRPTATFGPWSVIGPFPAASGPAAYTTAFEPEKKVDLAGTCLNGKLTWAEHTDWGDGAVHMLPKAGPCAWYLTRVVHAPSDQVIRLSLGSDDGCRLWLDGVEFFGHDIPRGVSPDQDRVQVQVTAGNHRLLMKINDYGGDCGFCFDPGARKASRGGVFDFGAVLMKTSQASRTSPVRRGVWVVQNLLGMPPPQPPAGIKLVGVTPAAVASGEDRRTQRQVLETHRQDVASASCHARFDAYGFALEQYGPDGLWRTHEVIGLYDKVRFIMTTTSWSAIDPSGTLPDGRTFADLDGLKDLLIARPEPFVRAFARKLLAFGLGRRLGPHDEVSVEAAVRAAAANGWRVRTLIRAIIASDAFQNH